jgi:nucleotidyltransferase substrate binding protein (TIGR01987 family)
VDSHTIILTPLKKALASLRLALQQPKNEFTRDASIQRFEYSFELIWKILKRFFAVYTGAEEYNIKNLFREAGRQGLITKVEPWLEYLQARNLTLHTYNEITAETTYEYAREFADDAEKLVAALEQRINDNA